MPGGVHPPLEVIQEWAKIANPEHPSQTRGWSLVVIIVVVYVIALLTVCGRLWARLVVLKNQGLDDALIVASMIPLTALAISTCLASRVYGFDRHAWDLTSEMAMQARKVTIAILLTYVLTTSLSKISILLFYRRLTSGAVSPFFKRITQASIFFVIAYMITFTVSIFFICHPFSAFWKSVDVNWLLKHPQGTTWTCINEGAIDLAASILSIVQDFLACGLPTALFWKLQLRRRQKIALGAIFGLGFLLCITGIFRIYYIYRIYYATYDVSWEAQGGWTWTVIEAMLAVICASLPALKVFFKKILKGSSFGSDLPYTFRRTGYSRHGYAKSRGTDGLGTQVSATFVGHGSSDKYVGSPVKDIELGGISVTKDVNVTTEESPPMSSYNDRDSQEQARKYGHGSRIRRMSSSEAPWLENPKPQDSHANGPIGRGYSSRNGWR